jgi:hypothetical protein
MSSRTVACVVCLQRRDEKDGKLRETVDMKAMSETRPRLATVKNDATGEEEQVLVGTFLPDLEVTKGFKPKNPAPTDESKPFWERLHVEKD